MTVLTLGRKVVLIVKCSFDELVVYLSGIEVVSFLSDPLKIVLVLSLPGAVDFMVLSLSENEAVRLFCSDTMGSKDIVDFEGDDAGEIGTGTTEMVWLTWTVTTTEDGLSLLALVDEEPETVLLVGVSSLLDDAEEADLSLSVNVVGEAREVVKLSFSRKSEEVVGLSLSLSLSDVEAGVDEDSLSVNGRVAWLLAWSLDIVVALAESLSLSSGANQRQSNALS